MVLTRNVNTGHTIVPDWSADVAIIFVPLVVATIALILIHRQTRRSGTDLPLVAAIGTGVILGLVTVEVVVIVVSVAAGAVTSSRT